MLAKFVFMEQLLFSCEKKKSFRQLQHFAELFNSPFYIYKSNHVSYCESCEVTYEINLVRNMKSKIPAGLTACNYEIEVLWLTQPGHAAQVRKTHCGWSEDCTALL